MFHEKYEHCNLAVIRLLSKVRISVVKVSIEY